MGATAKKSAGKTNAVRSNHSRAVKTVTRGVDTSDGAGVRLTRIIGSHAVNYVDPFLLLDEFKSENPDDYIAGFPPHPHRGMETVTYMIDGRVAHKDSMGHNGVIGPGDAQWMTAGSGVIHSEMPAMENGRLWGMQLWVNLPRARKMTQPNYQEMRAEHMPVVDDDKGVVTRVVAGAYRGVKGQVEALGVGSLYLDVSVQPGAAFSCEAARGDNVFAYVLAGSGRMGAAGNAVKSSELVVFEDGDSAEAFADGEGMRFILVAGTPLNEPVARGGPFVMNTQAEIQQAWQEYQAGTFVQSGARIVESS